MSLAERITGYSHKTANSLGPCLLLLRCSLSKCASSLLVLSHCLCLASLAYLSLQLFLSLSLHDLPHLSFDAFLLSSRYQHYSYRRWLRYSMCSNTSSHSTPSGWTYSCRFGPFVHRRWFMDASSHSTHSDQKIRWFVHSSS